MELYGRNPAGLEAAAGDHIKWSNLDYCSDTNPDGADGAVSNGRNEGICTCSAG